MTKHLLTSFFTFVFAYSSLGQTTTSGGQDFSLQLNTITTAVPFLLIAPDSRSGAMGDVGVALSPDANSVHWNLSKLAWINDNDYVKARGGNKQEFGMSLGYSPWLKALVPDINLAYLSAYKTIGRNQAFAGSLRYFSLGNITFTNDVGDVIRDFKPNEFAVDLGYTRMLSERFSGGVAIRYVFSNLTGGTTTQGGGTTKPGQSVAADISGFWRSQAMDLKGKEAHVAVGFNVSNIGAKMSYTSTQIRDFIPANLRLGSALDINIDEMNLFTFSVDLNKLLVPTPPLYQKINGVTQQDVNGNYIIESGRNPDVGVASGIFGSFTDAPGAYYDESQNLQEIGKFKEEMREVNISAGLEYWYAHRFALRGGFFYEHYTKGNRQYAAIGAGMKYKTLEIDLSYLIPTSQQHPLAKTLRFTLKFNFGEANEGETGKG
ncbi:type IX secretion system outer membrane channel protein PorV [Flavobacteriales bacterium]|nr:type IX secretion system outer membrane channel protein PorV [Flavobacteriales bacterium]MDC3337921.1 type IX secretion system outer membrane channel protein PorV [Flavobacteriales bacterium]